MINYNIYIIYIFNANEVKTEVLQEYTEELTQREIDLACGLKDKKSSIFTLLIFFIVSHCIKIFLSFTSSYIFIYQDMHDVADTSQCYVAQWS